MAVVTVTGEPGCNAEETARIVARRLGFELISEAGLRKLLTDEYGAEQAIGDGIFVPAVTAVLARLAREHHLVLSIPGSELITAAFPTTLHALITAPSNHRIGNLMLDHQLERSEARKLLAMLDEKARLRRYKQFRRRTTRTQDFDVIVNTGRTDADQAAAIIQTAAELRGLREQGPLTSVQEAELQFHARLKLARRGIAPAQKASITRKPFANESEEIFANLLEFYRIDWQYEPKSFAICWDAKGHVTESFTPDFYLPEFDLYIELTTMKQANVTRKNRKIKLLKTIYPQVNIQVFYQKDFQNLIFKYGLARPVLA